MDKPFLIFIAVILYLILLFIIRHFGLGSKESCMHCDNCCPDCSLALNRIVRKFKDKIVLHFTFRICDFKRYTSNECGWEGLRWEKKYKASKKN